jgi:hypothetical protein
MFGDWDIKPRKLDDDLTGKTELGLFCKVYCGVRYRLCRFVTGFKSKDCSRNKQYFLTVFYYIFRYT